MLEMIHHADGLPLRMTMIVMLTNDDGFVLAGRPLSISTQRPSWRLPQGILWQSVAEIDEPETMSARRILREQGGLEPGEIGKVFPLHTSYHPLAKAKRTPEHAGSCISWAACAYQSPRALPLPKNRLYTASFGEVAWKMAEDVAKTYPVSERRALKAALDALDRLNDEPDEALAEPIAA